MSETKATPEPWIVDESYLPGSLFVIRPNTPGYIAAIGYPLGHLPTDGYERIANARLIAAAPDLLAACRKALTCTHVHSHYARELRKAITKAEGSNQCQDYVAQNRRNLFGRAPK